MLQKKSFTVYLALISCLIFYSYHSARDPMLQQGDSLAHIYCQACHEFPEPSLLNKDTWLQHVLPAMGPRLGIFSYAGINYPSRKNDPHTPPHYYPASPVLTTQQWRAIINYYYSLAPEAVLPQQRATKIIESLPLFSIKKPEEINSKPPITSFVKIDPGNHLIYIADGANNELRSYNAQLQLQDIAATNSTVSFLNFTSPLQAPGMRAGYLSNIGILLPSEIKAASVQSFTIDEKGKIKIDPHLLADSLHRTVEVLASDFNKDGRTDLLVCDFGYLSGELYWLESIGNNKWEKHVLRSAPGAIKAYINDYNHDGLADIWVLFAQTDEGIFLYTNQGKGRFRERRLLRFPSVYGSSYFELDDFNNDGYPDILYTCGDNSDYSTVLKKYHGVYIFLNNRHYRFKQQYFFPINGCYKAIARDFDGDGDLDIATISFFPDYKNQPQESFVYLQNNGNWNFEPHTIKNIFQLGRWITMDAADIDGDGDDDIILGNFSTGPMNMKVPEPWKKGQRFILLQNNLRH